MPSDFGGGKEELRRACACSRSDRSGRGGITAGVVTPTVRHYAIWLIICLASLSAVQWARAQSVHEWFRFVSPRPNVLPGAGTHPTPAKVRVLELNGVGVACRWFDCWMRPSDRFGYDYLHAAPRDVRWTEYSARS